MVLILQRAGIVLQYHGGTEKFCELYNIPPTKDAERLVDRYLCRSARFRSSWMWIGIALAVVLSLGRQSFGLVAYPPTSNVFLMGLGAWFIGLVRSETYNLHGRRTGQDQVRRHFSRGQSIDTHLGNCAFTTVLAPY